MQYYQRKPLNNRQPFIHAANGIAHTFKNEINFKIHLLFTIAAVVAAFYFNINSTEWCFVIGCCMVVLFTELLNTAIENICNMITQEVNESIKIIKDTSAAAVLVSSIGSAVIGFIIFVPKIITLLK